MLNCGCGTQLVIPKSFNECYTYEMQLLWLKKYIDELENRVTTLENVIKSMKGEEVVTDEA